MSSSPSGTDRVELDADGTVVVANEDSKRVVWPGPKNSERVRLTVGGRPVVEKSGFWALHRLLDASPSGAAPGSTIATFNAEGREIRVELRARSVRHPLTLPALRGFACPGR